ncbi:MAG TPA: tetratricopeptide repeat protein [Steroidobacteraceae bacterium]|nr:tetratricopeptide repeat protein [Steroidobacteraceae bacterium]
MSEFLKVAGSRAHSMAHNGSLRGGLLKPIAKTTHMHCRFSSAGQLPTKLLSILVLLLWGASLASASGVDELDDAASRLQYAFYTADLRGLQDVIVAIDALELDSPPGAKEYQLAYGEWKLAQLYADPESQRTPVPHAGSLAGKAAEQCVKHARAAIQRDPRMADAHALDAICSGMPQGFFRLTGLSGANCEKSKSLKTAVELGPGNPRVQLISALCSASKSEKASSSVAKWSAVVASFESVPPASPGTPDWGHVEALTLLGESYLQAGDRVKARDALEKALVLAPDYHQAQRMLEGVAARPR